MQSVHSTVDFNGESDTSFAHKYNKNGLLLKVEKKKKNTCD